MIRQSKRTQDLTPYAGKWVAFSKNRIVATGESLNDVMTKMKAKRIRIKPALFLVPRNDEGPYVLVLRRRGC